ncbi:unnamed protein product [Sphacelaria rigidula]
MVRFAISSAAAPGDPAATETSKGKAGKGGKGAAAGADTDALGEADIAAFTVHPETWEIPPHEHRYVSAHFRPTEMRSYRCRFEAIVANNDDPSTGRMEFLLSGKGTMPTVTLESPLERDQTGAVLMDFGEVNARKSRRIPLILRNDGILPVSCLFEMELPDTQEGDASVGMVESVTKKRDRQRKGDFLFAAAGGSITLQPKERKSMDVLFQPRCQPKEGEPEALAQRLKMTVLHNQFDATTFLLHGSCVSHDVVFEDLPGASVADELTFDQVDILEAPSSTAEAAALGGPVGTNVLAQPTGDVVADAQLVGKEVTFSLWNQGATASRFYFASHKHFKFYPSVGHLPAGSRREIAASFRPEEPVKYESEPVEFATQRIRYIRQPDEGDQVSIETQEQKERRVSLRNIDVEWDDSKTQLREATEEDMAALLQQEAAAKGPVIPEKVGKKAKKGKEPVIDVPPTPTLRRGPLSEGGVQMVYSVQPEPRHEPLEGTVSSKRPLRCSGVADRARYEIVDGVAEGSHVIPFKNTAMFQCRGHTFTVR